MSHKSYQVDGGETILQRSHRTVNINYELRYKRLSTLKNSVHREESGKINLRAFLHINATFFKVRMERTIELKFRLEDSMLQPLAFKLHYK